MAQTEYKRRHDKMGLRVYWGLCGKYGLRRSEKWYQESPEDVRKSEDEMVEIWWDRRMPATKVKHNRPDVVVVDHVNKKWWFVDFAVPFDKNVATKEAEKINKYEELAEEARKMHKVTVEIVPIVVGALGVVTKDLVGWCKKVGIGDVVVELQTAAVIGTQAILRKVLKKEKGVT